MGNKQTTKNCKYINWKRLNEYRRTAPTLCSFEITDNKISGYNYSEFASFNSEEEMIEYRCEKMREKKMTLCRKNNINNTYEVVTLDTPTITLYVGIHSILGIENVTMLKRYYATCHYNSRVDKGDDSNLYYLSVGVVV
jgi:hypothetical protein